MFYTVYKITNWFNGKIYIGIHKTNDLNDGYMGSGKLIKRAIEKYGLQYFTKEYLQIFDNPDDMYEMESSLVNEDFIDRGDTYNLKEGGFGGWSYCNDRGYNLYGLNGQSGHGLENLEKIIIHLNKLRDDIEYRQIFGNKISTSLKNKYKNGLKSGFYGHSHTDETKQKMSKTAKERLKDPRNNSQYGTQWITNGIDNKKILKNSDIPDGWRLGRVMPKS